MGKYKGLIVFMMSLMLALMTFSFYGGVGFAVEGEQGSGDAARQTVQETTAPDNTDGRVSDGEATDTDNPSDDPSKEPSEEPEKNPQKARGAGDGDGDAGNVQSDGEEPVAEEPEEPLLQEPTRATLPSGSVSNGWIWKVTGEEGDYTLTFEYTGEADPAPTFTVPSRFIENIASDLSDAGLNKNSITKIIIPEGCVTIDTYAFQDMDGIEEVEIASTVKTIGNTVFGDNNNDTDAPLGCGKLKKVTIKTNSDGKSDLEYVGARAFNGCKALKTIENLEKTNLKGLGYGAFMNVAVEHFYIPDTVTSNTSSTYNMQYAFARNSSLKSISMPAPFYLYGNQTYTLAYCPNLEEIDFRTVEGATIRDEQNALPGNIFNSDTGLKVLDLSAYDKAASSTTTFTLSSSDFTNTNLDNLKVIVFPENRPVTINTNTFKNKHITSFEDWENVDSIKTIGTDAFNSSRLTSADMSDWTGLTSIGATAFRNCEGITNLVIPENVTSIGTAAFKNCDNLETVRVEATSLNTIGTSSSPVANLFDGDDNLKTVTISSNTKKINGNFLAAIPASADTFFEGENVIEITKATVDRGSKPLKSLNGKYYVDSQGVLYQLDEEKGTASLAYVPPGITSYTVPEKITTPGDGGSDFTVTAVNSYALNHAHDLTAISFDKPENIYLKTSAFTGWSTSSDNMGKTVQGKTAIDDVNEWRKVSSMCDFPIGTATELVPTIEDPYYNSDGTQALKVVVAVNDKTPSEDKTYDYLTGQIATYTIAISNDDNITLDKIVRIYFSYSDDGYKMGSFYEGEYNIKNPSTGTIYPMKVVQTDTPNVYYYEVTGILPGETLAFTNDIHYPSRVTGGGEVKIWTKTLTQEEAQEAEGEVINPDKKYMELDWLTNPIVFDLTKSNATYYDVSVPKARSPIIKTDSSGEAYVSSLAYRIKESNKSGSASTSEGLDFIKWVNYSDEITLPEELYWKPEILDALRNGNWDVEDVDSQYSDNGSTTMMCRAITVTVSGKKYYVAYLGKRGGYTYDANNKTIDNLKIQVISDKKLKLTWKVPNTSLSGASATNEYSVQDFYLRFGESVILADLVKVNQLLDANPGKTLPELLKVHNESDEVRHYSYSGNQTAASQANNPVDANYDVLIKKTFQNGEDSNRMNRTGGTDEFFNVTIDNSGILNLKNWGAPYTDENGEKQYDGHIIEDTFNSYLYIEPQNIEKMLKASISMGTGSNAQTAPIGDWLTITINKASLYTPDQYQVVDGTNQDPNKYSISTNISHAADNGMRVNEAAKFVIKKNSAGQIIATLSGDSIDENNKNYLIGPGGDFASINDLFTAVGYMPTRNTTYKADYYIPPEANFELKPGQKMVIPLLTTAKTTPMLLTVDKESYYVSDWVASAINNTARVRLQVGSVDRNTAVSTKYSHDWYRDLTFYKYGYVENGSQVYETSTLNDGTVIDSRLSATNSSGKAYEHMDFADYMTGAQVAMVPVEQNVTLKAPDGSDLDVFTSNGKSYYLLNKPGEYKNVTFGRHSTSSSASERNGLQNIKADITVSETISNGKRTSLNTLIKWAPFNNWGGTSTTSYIYYKTLVSSSKAGLAGADNPGETKTYTLDNKAWLGDHQGHRLYDTYGLVFQVYGINKHIVAENGKGDGTDSTSDGTLVKFSRIHHSDSVTYQITINNISTSPTVLNGSRIFDNLPSTRGKFTWEKGVNVTNVRYYGSDGVEIKYGSGSSAVDISTTGQVDSSQDGHWRIQDTSTSGQQQIRWDNNFNIHFPVSGSVKILVDLKFPDRTEGASIWDQYVAANAGNQLTNTFYLDSLYSSVNHLLESEGKAVLYKGVYDTGLTTRNTSSSYSSSTSYGSYLSNNTRLMYQNGTGSVSSSDSDLKASTITYYTVLYNGSYDRLYLSDLEDQLPKGFTFNSLCGGATTSNYLPYAGYLGYRTNSGSITAETYSNPLVTIDKSGDPYDNNTVKYKYATVAATTRNGSDGRQHITFKLTRNTSYSNTIGYDSEVGKYYLDPGEAVRFGYNVLIDQYTKTDDEATNTVTMPYYDYYGTGFILDTPDEDGNGGAIQKARAVSGITPNDGGCELMPADRVASDYGMDVSKYTADAYNSIEGGNFMISSVTVHRAPFTPGLQKTIGGLTEKAATPSATTIEGPSSGYGTAYKGGAKTSDVVNWKLRMYNEAAGNNADASGLMTGYTIQDTVDKPFGFTGRVYYDMYRATSANGTKVTSSTQYLFTIGTRKIAADDSGRDTEVKFSSGSTLTESGNRMVHIGDAADDSDDDWFSFGSGAKSGKVKLERDANGKEILTIKLTGTGYSIPAGHWIDMCVHTMYTFDEVIISEPKYNNAILYPEQDYDPDSVAQGKARTKQVMQDDGTVVTVNDGIQSGASIMLNQGYTTSSWKEITEIGDATNKARSDDSTNYIVLSEKSKSVKYDLYVIGPTTSISKMVVIDDLPQLGDHSAFVEDDTRDSEFSVGFLEDNLGLRVALAQKTGVDANGVNTYGAETVLDESRYDVYVSEKTEFDRATDWIGTGSGWTNISVLEGNELKTALTSARSIRVVVKDPNAWGQNSSLYTMTKEFRVHITFNARINDNKAKPGQIAWNSFGYKYQIPLTRNGSEENSASIYLEAQPLNVGLKYPNAPVLKKKLTEEVTETKETTDPDSGETTTEEVTKVIPHTTERDLNCRFVIYEGDPLESLNDISDKTDSEIAEILSGANKKYVFVPLEVKAGQSEVEEGLWSIDYCSKFEDGKFVDDTTQKWTWINDAKYTLLELNMGDGDIYDLITLTIDGREFEGNNHVFINTLDRKIGLTADNRYSDTDLILTKTMPIRADTSFSEEAPTNSTVVFKVVGKNKQGQVKYRNTVGISFNNETGASETRILKGVPTDLEITVTEVYSGNYEPENGKIVKTKVEKYEGDIEEYQGKTVWLFEFENGLDDNNFGSGVVNKYENKDGTITYNDGSNSGSDQEPIPVPEE